MGLSLGQDKPRALKSKPRPKLQYDTIFQTYSLVSIPHRNHLNLNLNPHKSVSTLRGPSFFFVTETSTHPNPHCELQRRGQGTTTPFRRQCRQGPPSPTLSSESTSEPQSRHWSGAWVCWFRCCGSLGLLIDCGSLVVVFDGWRRRDVFAEWVLKSSL